MGRQFDPEQFARAAGDAIIAAGTDGSIVFWNPAADRMFGYTRAKRSASHSTSSFPSASAIATGTAVAAAPS